MYIEPEIIKRTVHAEPELYYGTVMDDEEFNYLRRMDAEDFPGSFLALRIAASFEADLEGHRNRDGVHFAMLLDTLNAAQLTFGKFEQMGPMREIEPIITGGKIQTINQSTGEIIRDGLYNGPKYHIRGGELVTLPAVITTEAGETLTVRYFYVEQRIDIQYEEEGAWLRELSEEEFLELNKVSLFHRRKTALEQELASVRNSLKFNVISNWIRTMDRSTEEFLSTTEAIALGNYFDKVDTKDEHIGKKKGNGEFSITVPMLRYLESDLGFNEVFKALNNIDQTPKIGQFIPLPTIKDGKLAAKWFKVTALKSGEDDYIEFAILKEVTDLELFMKNALTKAVKGLSYKK